MMSADLLHITPSYVSSCWLSLCRCACSAGAFAPRFAQPPAQPSCLECERPEAVTALAGRRVANSAAPPAVDTCSARGRQRRKARQKGAALGLPQLQSARGVGAARRGFVAVPCIARSARCCRHACVLRTPEHALAYRGSSHDRPTR